MYSQDHRSGSGRAIAHSKCAVLGGRVLCVETDHWLTETQICALKMEVLRARENLLSSHTDIALLSEKKTPPEPHTLPFFLEEIQLYYNFMGLPSYMWFDVGQNVTQCLPVYIKNREH